jgi:hypothetical protein
MNTKIIKLTNANKLFEGKPLLINIAHLISVFETEVDGKVTTVIYAHTRDTWEVKETLEEVYSLIEQA